MFYNQRERLIEVKNLISYHSAKEHSENLDQDALEADILWNASRFCALLLHASKVQPDKCSIEEFEDFINNYNIGKSTPFDASSCFEKHWLRRIAGFVVVPTVIFHVVKVFEEVRDHRSELEFICQFYGDRSKRQQLSVPVLEVEEAAIKFEAKTSIILNRPVIFHKRWAQIDGDRIDISAMDIYFEPLLGAWDELCFLADWIDSKPKREHSGFEISEDAVQKLISSFENRSTHFPDFELLISQEIIVNRDASYRIEFRSSQSKYWITLQSEIAGHYWQLLIDDLSLADDRERLISWLTGNLSDSRYPDHVPNLTHFASERFLDAAIDLLLEDSDLEGIETELDKVVLDSREFRGVEALYKDSVKIKDTAKLNNSDLFELFHSLQHFESQARITYLYGQASRYWLIFLTETIVRYDLESVPDDQLVDQKGPFLRINRLLKASTNKPFLLWATCNTIQRHRPEILTHLLIQPESCTLALSILENLEFPDTGEEIYQQCWVKAVDLLFRSLPQYVEGADLHSRIKLQIFRLLNEKKYKMPYRYTAQHEQIIRRRDMRNMAVLDLVENLPLHYGQVHGGPTPMLFTKTFEALANAFINLDEPRTLQPSVKYFPLLRWGGIAWLLKATMAWKVRGYFRKNSRNIQELVSAFLNQYLTALEEGHHGTAGKTESETRAGQIIWTEQVERLEMIDWIFPIYFLNEQGKLGRFLNPRLDFQNTTDNYHTANRLTAEKLRTHIGVLLQLLQKLIQPASSLTFDKSKLEGIEDSVQKQIVVYLNEHTIERPEEGKIDLFSLYKEGGSQSSAKTALLPQIAQAINWFADTKPVVNALIKSGDINKFLTVLDFVAVESIRGLLIEQLMTSDIIGMMERQVMIPEIQTTLAKLSNHPELLPKFEQALQVWENRIKERHHNKEYREQIYISRLIVAFLKNDEAELEAVLTPGIYHGSSSELSYQDYKSFYRGLLYLTLDPEKAVNSFNDLANRFPNHVWVALNRMEAKLLLGEFIGDTFLLREAYEQWSEFEKENPRLVNLGTTEPEISAITMKLLFKLSEHNQLERRFLSLEVPVRMNEKILEIRIKSLIQQNRPTEARLLVETAKSYHRLNGNTPINFIEKFELLVNGDDDLEQMRASTLEILSCYPTKLVKLLPESFNGKADIYEFFVQEIVNALDKMLDKIRSIDEIKDENKLNDIVELVLDSRLTLFGFHISGQSRGAFSAATESTTKKQPGERDLPIMDRNQKIWMVCEALIYRGKTTAESHLKKAFNYHHKRDVTTLLYYDTDCSNHKRFEKNWKDYKDDILPKTTFPEPMTLNSRLEEISDQYDLKNSAIKIGKTIHGTGTVMYHIFVNINYKL